MNSIGDRIKKIRKDNFYTQVEFAKLLGISQGTLSDIEKGNCSPSFNTLKSLRTLLKVDLNDLFENK
ncbi:helix-turn-helix domain-containing protein [Peribacillus sp. B-H-3]|uniref:helix-turn-helix domain-containing protein n=1 Tax=Peribacillus sp. B-H-3 TaxID=3400420 RepID=UPI003B011F0F